MAEGSLLAHPPIVLAILRHCTLRDGLRLRTLCKRANEAILTCDAWWKRHMRGCPTSRDAIHYARVRRLHALRMENWNVKKELRYLKRRRDPDDLRTLARIDILNDESKRIKYLKHNM